MANWPNYVGGLHPPNPTPKLNIVGVGFRRDAPPKYEKVIAMTSIRKNILMNNYQTVLDMKNLDPQMRELVELDKALYDEFSTQLRRGEIKDRGYVNWLRAQLVVNNRRFAKNGNETQIMAIIEYHSHE